DRQHKSKAQTHDTADEPARLKRNTHHEVQHLRPGTPRERLTQCPGNHSRHCRAQASRSINSHPPTPRATAAYRLSTPSPTHGDSVPSSLLVVLREFPTIKTGTKACN